jgi:hypothetical protein
LPHDGVLIWVECSDAREQILLSPAEKAGFSMLNNTDLGRQQEWARHIPGQFEA